MPDYDFTALAEAGYIEAAEAAERMNMSVEAVTAMAKSGVLKSVLVGGERLIRPAILSGSLR